MWEVHVLSSLLVPEEWETHGSEPLSQLQTCNLSGAILLIRWPTSVLINVFGVCYWVWGWMGWFQELKEAQGGWVETDLGSGQTKLQRCRGLITLDFEGQGAEFGLSSKRTGKQGRLSAGINVVRLEESPWKGVRVFLLEIHPFALPVTSDWYASPIPLLASPISIAMCVRLTSDASFL